jgi:hypothetical protein
MSKVAMSNQTTPIALPAPWRRRYSTSASTVVAEHVHTGQVEMPHSLQHVAIVGKDLFKAMLLSAGQL